MMREDSDETQQAGAVYSNGQHGLATDANGATGASSSSQRSATRGPAPSHRLNAAEGASTAGGNGRSRARANGSNGTTGKANAAGASTLAAPAAPTSTPRTRSPRTSRATKSARTATGGITEHQRNQYLSPENTIFVSLSFEGPDIYSTAGGLGTHVTELTESLAQLGYETHLIFVGDPTKPATETLVDDKLHLKRWGQWISKYYPNGVYDGEEQKLYDYSDTVPYHIYEQIARPAIEAGKIVVVIGEDWHTADAIMRTSDLLHWHNLRRHAKQSLIIFGVISVILWLTGAIAFALGWIPVLGWFFTFGLGLLHGLLWIVAIVLWILLMVMAYSSARTLFVGPRQDRML